jgi:uncharacterized membrane protein YgdD (TMEM256/DUF423 family)
MAEDNSTRQIAIGDYKAGATAIGSSATVIVNQLAEADPSDVQQIAASEIRLLINYYDAVLDQAKKSFRWALVAAGIGLVFFMGALAFLLAAQASLIATISVIGGAVVEVIAGINFVLYGRTTAQLSDFHQRLDRTQRFLLANSICASLNGEIKDKTRAALVHTIATTAMLPPGEEVYSQQASQ